MKNQYWKIVVSTAVVGGTIMCTLLWKLYHRFGKKKICIYPNICTTLQHWQAVQEEFLGLCEKSKVIGLDCEWVTKENRRHPVALLQLGTIRQFCVLIRLSHIRSLDLPTSLLDVLSDKRVLKVGVGIWEDRKKLLQDHGILVEGCLDLRHLIEKIPEAVSVKSRSLQGLAKDVLGIHLKKSSDIRCSNWEATELSPVQIHYAAQDAMVAVNIFQELMKLKMQENWLKQLFVAFDESLQPAKATQLCEDVIDTPFRQTDSPSKTVSKSAPPTSCSTKREDWLRAYSIRQKPLYHNCQLQAPDGEPLCTCDIKKAQWYIDKDLGNVIEEDPLTVRLKFQPAGRPILDSKYYLQEKNNQCVVCGASDSYIRKNIVPQEYRKYFPSIMKNHVSHDIVLLCPKCHHTSNLQDYPLRQQLALECNAPTDTEDAVKGWEDSQLRRVRSAARALVRNKSSIPPNRVQELEQLLKQFYGVTEVSEHLLVEAMNLDTCIPNENYTPHGLKVVQYISKHGGLLALESRWRQHFLDTMKPRFLPKMWSVEHNHECLALKIAQMTEPDFDISVLGYTEQQLKEVLKKYHDLIKNNVSLNM